MRTWTVHAGEEFISGRDHGGILLLEKDDGVENDEKVEDIILLQNRKEEFVTLEKISSPVETMAEFCCWIKMKVCTREVPAGLGP